MTKKEKCLQTLAGFKNYISEKGLKEFEIFTKLAYQENKGVKIKVYIGQDAYVEQEDSVIFCYYAKMQMQNPKVFIDYVDENERIYQITLRDAENNQMFFMDLSTIGNVVAFEYDENRYDIKFEKYHIIITM